MADIANAVPIDENTVFYSASLAKPVTAVAVLQLVESGLIGLDDSISKWIPEVPRDWQSITIHHLLSNQTGIPDWISGVSLEDFRKLDGVSNTTLITSRATIGKLAFPAGSAGQYSNSNYILLARVVERASGVPFAKYVTDRVFTPAGMLSSYVGTDLAVGHTRRALNFGISDSVFGIHLKALGASGLYTSVRDLTAFVDALLDCRLLKTEYVKLMGSPQSALEPRKLYGYGWFVSLPPAKWFSHRGAFDGYRSFMRVNILDGVDYFVLANGGDVSEKHIDQLIGVVTNLLELHR